MSKDPAFLFYPGDWLGGTLGMTLEEKGAYMEVLMLQFNRGHMEGHMIGQVVGQLWDKIKHKFVQDENGLWYNPRLEIEKNKRKSFTDSRKNNLTGKNQYAKNNGHMGGHMTKHMENENEDESINKDDVKNSFSVFWNLYGKKEGKSVCEKKWKSLSEKDRQEILKVLPNYIAWKKDIQYRPMPSTFLNQRRWEDEIPVIKTDQIRKEHTPRDQNVWNPA